MTIGQLCHDFYLCPLYFFFFFSDLLACSHFLIYLTFINPFTDFLIVLMW